MPSSREYPERPLVGVGGVVIENGRALLIRRGSEPLRGEWSIPGGNLEVGETIQEGVARELLEETGLEVRVLDLIVVFDRILYDDGGKIVPVEDFMEPRNGLRPRFHYVIVDYLCERISGEPRAGSDVTDLAFVREEELEKFRLRPKVTEVLHRAFAMARALKADRS